MPFNFKGLTYILGDSDTIEQMLTTPALPPFYHKVEAFLNALSKKLMITGRSYSDVATFGFWCRKAALKEYKAAYSDLDKRLGRGIVFHSTPSNVPVNFAFSLATGLLAGNANIVRLPAKAFVQVDVICQAIDELIKGDFNHLAPYVCLLKYEPNKAITDALSSTCDTRVIWGGDTTIKEIRQSPLKPRANEVTFADRHSLAVIDADVYLQIADKAKVARDFYNDTYFSDQNACTAPRLVVWLGDKISEAQELFWRELAAIVRERYTLLPVQAVGKLAALYQVAAANVGVRLTGNRDNYVMRVTVDALTADLMEHKYNSGFFFEYAAGDIAEILPVCDSRCQTVGYLGVDPEEICGFVQRYRPRGVDRIVPLGKTMDFALVWDGVDLIRGLSRVC